MSLSVVPIPCCVGCCAGILGQGSAPCAGVWEDPWEGAAAKPTQCPPRFFLLSPHPLWSRSCLDGAMPAHLAGSWLVPRCPCHPRIRIRGALWKEHRAYLCLPPPSLLPESPEGVQGTDRSSHRHRDLLVALSWFSKLPPFPLGALWRVPVSWENRVFWGMGGISVRWIWGLNIPSPGFWTC